MLDITKMLTLSTAHISEHTEKLLSQISEDKMESRLIVYKKGEYGYFIYVTKDADGIIVPYKQEIPEELHQCLCLADELGCNVLCFDRDGEISKALKTFDW